MTYLEDLTTFRFGLGSEDGVLSVGWLDRRHPFRAGETSEEFRNKLGQLCRRPTKRYFGFHDCELCNGAVRPAGNGEIRVSDGNVMYAAPTLIYHYVVAHAYLPPEAFIAAVLAWKDPSGPVEHE